MRINPSIALARASWASVILFLSSCSFGAEGNEYPGALNPIGCVPISSVSSENTPVDIFVGVNVCFSIGEYQLASDLMTVAGAFGSYDAMRVRDESTHQAVHELSRNQFMKLSSDQRSILKKLLVTQVRDASYLARICSEISAIGPPNYYPSYMVQRGSSDNLEGEPPVKRIAKNYSWKTVQKLHMGCP